MGDLMVFTFTLLLDICLVLTKHWNDSVLDSQALLPLTFPVSITARRFPKSGFDAEAG